MSKTRRSQLITDQIVQGELLFRAIVYWFFCLLVVELLVLGWSLMTGPPRPLPMVVRQSLAVSAPAIFGSVLLLPLVLLDVLKVSNRFVGPVQNIRCTMRQLAEGEPARRVYLRRDDFWQELAHYTNMVADKLETEEWDGKELDDLEEQLSNIAEQAASKTTCEETTGVETTRSTNRSSGRLDDASESETDSSESIS